MDLCRDKSHTLAALLAEDDMPKLAEIDPGDGTVHHERMLHGSDINSSNNSWTRAWVMTC